MSMKHIMRIKKWGYEIWFANNDLYCGKKLFVRKNTWSSDGKFHYHKIKDETFYIIKGRLELEFYDYNKVKEFKQSVTISPVSRLTEDEIRRKFLVKQILNEGMSCRMKPYTCHRFRGYKSDCTFIEASTHHDDSDSYYEKGEEE